MGEGKAQAVAPACRRSRSTAANFFFLADISAVSPQSSTGLRSAPAATSATTTGQWQMKDLNELLHGFVSASDSVVLPPRVCMSTSAPAPTSFSATGSNLTAHREATAVPWSSITVRLAYICS